MIKHPLLCRAKDENDNWIYGFFVKLQLYTPSPIKDDNDKPVPCKCFMVRERDIDWNLSTELEFVEVKEEALCQYVGNDNEGNQIFKPVQEIYK